MALNNKQIKAKVQKMAEDLGGTFRISQRGVPRAIVSVGETTYSICWFAKTSTWRVFYPYGLENQTKIDTPKGWAIIDALNSMRSIGGDFQTSLENVIRASEAQAAKIKERYA